MGFVYGQGTSACSPHPELGLSRNHREPVPVSASSGNQRGWPLEVDAPPLHWTTVGPQVQLPGGGCTGNRGPWGPVCVPAGTAPGLVIVPLLLIQLAMTGRE